jgi:hypothetical protein
MPSLQGPLGNGGNEAAAYERRKFRSYLFLFVVHFKMAIADSAGAMKANEQYRARR